MAQLTIYLDEDMRRQIEVAARRERVSVSRWVSQRLRQALKGEWPQNYFRLFGSLATSDLERPSQPDPSADAARESLD